MGDLPPAVSEWVPFDSRDGRVLVDVTINGVPGRALLDTGAEGSGITKSYAEKNGIGIGGRGELIIRGAFGEKRLDTAEEFKISFVGKNGAEGGIPVRQAILIERELDFDVLLGLQFFRGLVLQIDYPNSRLRYMTRSASAIAKQANIKAKREDLQGRLLMEVEIDGGSEWVLLDTGASGSIYLERRTAREGGWLKGARPAGQVVASGLIEDATVEQMVLNKLKVGPYELVDVPLTVQKLTDAHEDRPDPKLGSRLVLSEEARPGVLGYDILRHFVVTIDLEEELLHLYGP